MRFRTTGCVRVHIAFEPAQVRADFRGMLIAKVAVLFEGFADDFVQLCWQIRIQPGCGDGRALKTFNFRL
jgi:hypothetical protein